MYVEKKSVNEYVWTKLNKKQREKETEKLVIIFLIAVKTS
jgi:hypothetical protein